MSEAAVEQWNLSSPCTTFACNIVGQFPTFMEGQHFHLIGCFASHIGAHNKVESTGCSIMMKARVCAGPFLGEMWGHKAVTDEELLRHHSQEITNLCCLLRHLVCKEEDQMRRTLRLDNKVSHKAMAMEVKKEWWRWNQA